jgi:protein TonB
VKVKVIGVDSTMKRISLSMKAIMPKPQRRPRPRKKPKPAAAAAPSPAAVIAAPEGALYERPGGHRPPLQKEEQPRLRPPQPRPPQPRPQKPAQAARPKEQQPRPPKSPVETVSSPQKQTMEEKIRLLQEKFGRAR